MKLLVVVRHDLSGMLQAPLFQQSHEVIQVYALVVLRRAVRTLTTDGPAAPEFDGTLGSELKALAEIVGLLSTERMQAMQGAVNQEMLLREQPVTLPEEFKGEVEVTPTPQFTGIQISAPQLTVLRLWGGKDVGLVFRLEDEELSAIVLQDLHHPFLTLLGIFGNVHGTVAPE